MILSEQRKMELIQKANDLGKFKGQRAAYEHYRKVLKARLMKKAMANGVTSVQAQEREAYADPDYENIINAIQIATEEETRLYWELKIFETEIQVWRTEQANDRRESQL